MGASRIQGITVEIGGDTTKLTAALKGVNGEIRTTQSQLRDVERLLKLDPGHGTAGTEAQAPCGCGAGDEGKTGNPESGCGTGK